jgi:predicted nucleotidyltransferase
MPAVSQDTLDEVLDEFVQEARQAFSNDLLAVILFGSGAEGRLRQSSDVNLLVYLDKLDATRLDAFRATLRVCHTSIRASVMFLLKDELQEAATLFAVKFNDIKNRHRLLCGTDPFPTLEIDQAALHRRTREVLLNLGIRLRERYALLSLRQEQLLPVIADAAAPLRSAALALLELQGKAAGLNPRDALLQVVQGTGREDFAEAVQALSLAREQQILPDGQAGTALLALSALAGHLLRCLTEAEGAL